MTALTLQQQFGANAAIANNILSIHLTDLTAVGLTGSLPSPAEIAAALILHWKANQGANAADDPTIGVVVNEGYGAGKTFAIRGDQKQLEYQYEISIYTPDTTSSLDPDSVV